MNPQSSIAAAIEDAALTEYAGLLVEDGKGGWPMLQAEWEGTGSANFNLETVMAFNVRNAMGSEVLSAYVDIDKFDTSQPSLLYVSSKGKSAWKIGKQQQ